LFSLSFNNGLRQFKQELVALLSDEATSERRHGIHTTPTVTSIIKSLTSSIVACVSI
jgi:hypothetical protein